MNPGTAPTFQCSTAGSNDCLVYCCLCGERIGFHDAIRVIDGEGHAVVARPAEVHIEPRRYRSRVLHADCALVSDVPFG